MPKMKTHSAAAKRYKVTGSGKILRKKTGRSHILVGKTRKRKRNMSKSVEIYKGHEDKVKKELPYLKYSR